MEPIKIKATPVPVAKEIEAATESDSDVESTQSTETQGSESSVAAEIVVEVTEAPSQGRSGKKRRRAASSGVITPGNGPSASA